MREDDIYDITIIGAGPTGLFGAFYAGMREMKTKIIETLHEPGGQLTVLYPEKLIYDTPGYPRIFAKDLVKNLMEQAQQFNPTLDYGEKVLSIANVDGVISVTTDQRIHYTKTLLITAGIGAFHPNRLDVPGVTTYENSHIFYFVKDKNYFRGKRLLIIGGGDSAVDWSLNLMHWAKEVTLIHRRDVFRAHERSVTELFASDVKMKLFHELKEVRGNDSLKEAVIYHTRTKEETILPVDCVLIQVGHKADLGPVKEWGLELENRYVKVNGRMETNLKGIYAAGDMADPTGSVRLNLIATGFGQAAIAVNCAKNYIDPKSQVFPGHSSEKKF